MTKAELVEKMAKGSSTKSEADNFLNKLVAICQEALRAGEEVVLTGLGKFKVVTRAERAGRNPQDGSPREARIDLHPGAF